MPAYRSEAEAEIRGPVVEHLRQMIPNCRIIHEINACGFGNRIDVLAVGLSEIAAVEIKSEKDKLDRLPDQIKAMQGVAHRVYAAIHEKFLTQSHHSDDVYPPEQASRAIVWVYPKAERKGHVECRTDWKVCGWNDRRKSCLPDAAIHILWREELQAICRALGVPRAGSLVMEDAIDAIRWQMTGEQITREICRALRARQCPEADAPISDDVGISDATRFTNSAAREAKT